MLNDILSRVVQDILVASIDNLSGFKEAIVTEYPQTVVQLSAVHQVRMSLNFVVWKDKREFALDIKEVYAAINLEKPRELLKILGRNVRINIL